jgi:hypothetical protein
MQQIQTMFTRTQGTINTNNLIMTAILDNNLPELKLLINKTVVNNQINLNGDTCVLLACRLNRQQILNYLLNILDAQINIKNNENEDSFDVGTEKIKRILYEYKDKKANLELASISTKLNLKNSELKNIKEELIYIKKNLEQVLITNTESNERIQILESKENKLSQQYQQLLKDNNILKLNLDLEKKNVINEKRKATESENAYLNLKRSKNSN